MIRRCCSSLCSSGCFRRKVYDSDESDDEGEEQTKFEDLMLTPNKIDSNLEQNIAEWQEAINEYKMYEDNFLELNDPRDDLRTIIKALRKKPHVFLSSTYSVNVRKLAEKKVAINKLQKKLGLSKEMQAALLNSEVDVVPVSNYDTGGDASIVSNPLNSSIIMRDSSVNVSTKISVLWASRLNEINPTQGALQLQEGDKIDKDDNDDEKQKNETQLHQQQETPAVSSSNNKRPAPLTKHASLDMKIRPKWPDFLVDISYDVIKVNRFGHQMRRTLKLTQNHVINIKNGCVISKFYHLNDIRRTWLESGNTIRVQQRNDKHNIYRSPIAAHILQQIITRVQVRASLDRTEFSTSSSHIDRGALISTGIHSSAAIAAIIRNIAEENTLETEAVMATFANDLKQRAVRSVSVDLRASEKSSSRRSETCNEDEEDEEDEGEFSDEQQSAAVAVAAAVEAEKTNTETAAESEEVQTVSSEVTSEALDRALLHCQHLLRDPQNNQQQTSDSTTAGAEEGGGSGDDATAAAASPTSSSTASFVTANTGNTTSTAAAAAPAVAAAPSSPPRPVSVSQRRQRSTSNMSTGSASTTTSSSTATSAAPRFLNFREGMPEFSAQKAVQNIIFDDSTSEGNTRKLFIEKFSSCATSSSSGSAASPEANKARLLEVRLFIDGMHEYLLTHRGISLALLYEQEKQRAIISSASNGVDGAGTGGSTAAAAGAAPTVGSSVASTRNASKELQAQRQLTRRKSLQFLKDNMDLSVVEDSLLVFISFIIFIVVEEALFLPLRNQLISYLPGGGKMEEEHQLVARMKALCSRNQQQWGVPEELVSPLGWQSATFELAGVEHNLTPSSQLHILTRTIKAIYNEFKLVVLPRLEAEGKHDVYIGADDLVPIFLYVFCHSNLRHPIRNRDLMWSLCHPDQLHGEGGYYLTVYESAIEFVLNEPLHSDNNNNSSSHFTAGSRSSLTNNPLHNNSSSAHKPSALSASFNTSSSSNLSRSGVGMTGFDGLEDSSSEASGYTHNSSNSHRRMTKLTAREKFLDSLALKLRGIHHFVGGALRGAAGGSEDSRSRVMSGEYAMRESFY